MSRPVLSALVLAAGASRRLGRAKQLVPVDDEPLVRRTARLACSVCDHCVVVIGHEAEAVAATLGGLDVTLAPNPDWDAGMGGSLAFGVRALDPGSDGVMILPCDLPRITGGDLERLARAWQAAPDRAVAARYGSVTGIPVIFPRARFQDLARLGGDRGAARLLDEASTLIVDCERAGDDLDTPQDLERLTRC